MPAPSESGLSKVYYYGTLVDAGGKNKSNIHLDTKDGLIMIDADEFLHEIREGSYVGQNIHTPYSAKFGILDFQNIPT